MNKKARTFNLQGMLIGVLILGLFFGIISQAVTMLGSDNDISSFDADTIQAYTNAQENLSKDVQEIKENVDGVTVDKSWFDFFAGIFNKILAPFKFTYRSFSILINLTSASVQNLSLLKIVGDFVITLLTILVIIGVVMIKNYMGRAK